MSKNKTLYYIHDPMCSWCWGFRKTWSETKQALDDQIDLRYVVGGLAPDTNEPMPEDMQMTLQATWRRIKEAIPGTEFNFDFWTENQPRRATYPACRAVLAARKQALDKEQHMVLAIQQAYYLHAKNPSDDEILIELAGLVGLNTHQFSEHLNSDEIHTQLHAEIALGQSLGAQGFPSLVLHEGGHSRLLRINYKSSDFMLKQIR